MLYLQKETTGEDDIGSYSGFYSGCWGLGLGIIGFRVEF